MEWLSDLLFILLVLLLILAMLLARLHYARAYIGGANSYYYHGSDKIIKKFEPRPAGVIDGEKAVFATSDYVDAVIYSAGWTDYDFSFGIVDGVKYLAEQYPGAFDKLKCTRYIHYVDPAKFHHDDRLGMPNEFISYEPVRAIKYDVVDVYDFVTTSGIKLIPFNADLKPVDTIEPQYQERVRALYTPVDFYWDPDGAISGNNGTVINIDRLSDDELNKKIAGIDGNVILVGDPVDIYAGEIKFGFLADKFLLIPAKLEKSSHKTTNEEYKKFIDARKTVMRDFTTAVV